MTSGSAAYAGVIGSPYYRTEVGAYDAKPSDSPYETFDQGGNVWEWNEAVIGSYCGVRGGSFYALSDDNLRAVTRGIGYPPSGGWNIGFRVAEVGIPQPQPPPIPTASEWGVVTMALLVLTAATVVLARRGAETA